MKYVIMIHSSPQPWGHPTPEYLPDYQDMPREQRNRLNAEFEKMLGELHEKGELLGGEALGAPRSSRLYRWDDGKPLVTDGPTEAKEHLAGFFLIDVDSHARAEEIAARFAGPGETVELRPTMRPGGGEQ
ncbi:YciI family protein [Lentzea sp. NPDC055074]